MLWDRHYRIYIKQIETANPEIYKRIIVREREAQKTAEFILEEKSSALYTLSNELQKSSERHQSLSYQKNSELEGLFENLVDVYWFRGVCS